MRASNEIDHAPPPERIVTVSIRLDDRGNVVGHIIGSNFSHAMVNSRIPEKLLQAVSDSYLILVEP